MNQLRRILGIIWMALGPLAIYFMVAQALLKVSAANSKIATAVNEAAKSAAEAAKLNIQMQWGIIILIFVPIAFGLIIFGFYSLKGEYDRVE
jgi:NADH:ubiquinone oxidoreductase subunit 3 (subunit A)